MRRRKHSPSKAAGASGLEMTIVVTLFLVIVLGAVYLGFFSVAKSLVDAGLGRGLDLASTHPGFNDDPPVGCKVTDSTKDCCAIGTNSSLPWCQAVISVQEETLKIPTSSILRTAPGGFAYITQSLDSVDVKMPRPLAGQNLNSAYKDTPVEITVTYQALNVFGQYVTMTRSGFIFREVATQGAFNVTTDCNGYPEHSPQFGTQDCVCDAASGEGSAIIGGVRQCVQCTSLAVDSVAVNGGTVVDPITGNTVPSHSSTNFYVFNGADSSCHCPTLDYCQATYGAGAHMYGTYDQKCQCYCNPSFGVEWQTLEPGDSCDCKGTVPAIYPTSTFNDNGGTTPAVTFKPTRVSTTHHTSYLVCGCELSEASQAAYGGKKFIDNTMCGDWFNGLRTRNYDGCSCRCKFATSLGNLCTGGDRNGTRNYSSCTCTCPSGTTIDSNGRCQCDPCPAGQVVTDTSTCKCETDCGINAYRESDGTCSCNCGEPWVDAVSCVDCTGNSG